MNHHIIPSRTLKLYKYEQAPLRDEKIQIRESYEVHEKREEDKVEFSFGTTCERGTEVGQRTWPRISKTSTSPRANPPRGSFPFFRLRLRPKTAHARSRPNITRPQVTPAEEKEENVRSFAIKYAPRSG